MYNIYRWSPSLSFSCLQIQNQVKPLHAFLDFSREQGGVSGLFVVTGDFIYRFDLAVEECQFQMGSRETALSSIRFCDPIEDLADIKV
jgi:hypothetical protein